LFALLSLEWHGGLQRARGAVYHREPQDKHRYRSQQRAGGEWSGVIFIDRVRELGASLSGHDFLHFVHHGGQKSGWMPAKKKFCCWGEGRDDEGVFPQPIVCRRAPSIDGFKGLQAHGAAGGEPSVRFDQTFLY
jgi:hypothetical protein